MNPFERINEMKQAIEAEVKSKGLEEMQGLFTAKEHYGRMFNMLSILEKDLKDAEYHYEVESVNYKIKTFEEMTVLQKDLNEDVIIFQPIAIGEEELSAIDMQSLSDVLVQLRDAGQIKENMILLPPNINVFRAKLAEPKENTED